MLKVQNVVKIDKRIILGQLKTGETFFFKNCYVPYLVCLSPIKNINLKMIVMNMMTFAVTEEAVDNPISNINEHQFVMEKQ